MSYTIALNFEDGVSRFIQCNENEKVLDAAYRQQINLPMDCSDGVCGTCKCRCESGAFELGDDYLEGALSDEEREQQLVLTCQMVPQSDCVIQVPMTSSLCKTSQQRCQAEVVAVNVLSESALELVLEMAGDLPLTFLSGQYVNLSTPDGSVTRAYSFSSLPGERQLSFLIRNVQDGRMSHWLTSDAQPGALMTLTGPQGSFYLRPAERPLLMLAGGTGLAPLLSMLHSLQHSDCQQPVHLIYGVSRDADRVKTDVLDRFCQQLPHFSYQLCVSDPDTCEALTGHVTDHIDASHLYDGEVDIYLCGPPPMVDAVSSWLRDNQIAPGNFWYEKFTPQTLKESA